MPRDARNETTQRRSARHNGWTLSSSGGFVDHHIPTGAWHHNVGIGISWFSDGCDEGKPACAAEVSSMACVHRSHFKGGDADQRLSVSLLFPWQGNVWSDKGIRNAHEVNILVSAGHFQPAVWLCWLSWILHKMLGSKSLEKLAGNAAPTIDAPAFIKMVNDVCAENDAIAARGLAILGAGPEDLQEHCCQWPKRCTQQICFSFPCNNANIEYTITLIYFP